MKAKEFRLGNFIYKFGIDYIGDNPIVDRDNFEIIKVDIDVIKNIEDFNGTTDFYYTEPIPLTEEILLKCGFYYSDDDDEFLEYKVFKSFKFHADYSDKFSCISYRINDTTNEIKFLHQLQNLYWCLCGEELTFNNL